MGLIPTRDPEEFAPRLASVPFLQDAPKSALKAVERDTTHFSIPGGGNLFEQGDPGDAIYFLVSGSLGAFRQTPDGRNEFVGHIRAGEPVGEMSLVAGESHQNSVFALRDSELIKLSRRGFMKLVRSEPAILERLTRIILLRLRQSRRKTPRRAEPKVFALVATSPTIDLTLRANVLVKALESLELKVVVVDESHADKDVSYFDDLEARHDIVLFKAAIGNSNWYKLTMRYADRIWVLARADARPSIPLLPDDDSPARQFKLVDVVLLHHGDSRKGADPEEWASAAKAARVFHWHKLDDVDSHRLARIMSGRSVGVVMSGGGARAYAHIGVVKALREAGCPIDFVGGASMGAVVAACVAHGWSDSEIENRIRRAFVDSNPLGDYNIPVVGLVKGERVDNRLQEHFGERTIESLEIPFFAVSTNLTTGAYRVHNRGILRHALRASISLPGILPPVIEDGDILVDGAVLNNFPVDVMRDLHRGRIIGVDVARAPEGLSAEDFINPPGFLEWTLQNGFSAVPPIASLLMRAATVSVDPNAGRDLTDLLITPDLGTIELRDWRAYDEVVEAGYLSTKRALAQVTGPLNKLIN